MKFFKKVNWMVASAALAKVDGERAEDGVRASEPGVTAETPKIDFAVGGQAVIEGVMMRSPSYITIAVRKIDGSIRVRDKKFRNLTQRFKWLNIPILRGVINLFEMMVIGTEAINFSANESLEEPKHSKDGDESAADRVPHKEKAQSRASVFFEYFMFALSLVFALAMSIFLFKFVPLWVATYFDAKSSYIHDNYIVFNLIDGAIKISVFITYMAILGVIPSFKRIFEYHGAEHKAIFNYEKKLPLNVENARGMTRFHPRCGTSFILIVFLISVIVYTFIPKQESFTANLLLRVAMLPLIAGISYEYLKLSAKYARNGFVKLLILPGLWFQRLTTREPKDDQLEVSLESLKAALRLEGQD